MKTVKTWEVKMVTGDVVHLDAKSYDRLMTSNTKQGRVRPKWQDPNSVLIFLEHIALISPVEWEEVLKEDCENVEEPIEEYREQDVSSEEKEEAIMKELIEKSSCKHAAEDAVLTVQQTSRGTRYFNVCGFCGQRGRYVKSDSISEEQKAGATEWVDKE